jgi:hypothetical protein
MAGWSLLLFIAVANSQKIAFLAGGGSQARSWSWEMIPAELATLCHDYAARCWLFAQRQENASDKLALIEMAQAWVALADWLSEPAFPPDQVSDANRRRNLH